MLLFPPLSRPPLAASTVPWDDIGAGEGIGRGLDDTFQEEMADKLARTGGGMVVGRGGTGNSHLIKFLNPKLEKQGYKVICIAFTHVALANLNGVECRAHTILHLPPSICWQ